MIYENILYPQNYIIKKYVHSFWILRTKNPEGRIKPYLLPPDKYFNIILSFKSNTNIIKNNIFKSAVSGSFIVGMRTAYVLLQPDGDVDYLAIAFYPHTLRCFLNFHCINITDNFFELDLLKSKFNEVFKPVLNEVYSDEKRIEIIEKRLLLLIEKIDYVPNNYLVEALNIIQKNNGLISIQNICNDIGTSVRQLNRDFEKFVGISPKFYSRIVRFNNLLDSLKNMEKFENFADIAYYCGYFDQAHMIHECFDFTGLSPKQLLNY